MNIIRLVIICFSILTAFQVSAAYVQGNVGHITFLSVYSRSTAPGDIFVRVSNAPPECETGYYVLADSPGKAEVLSMLLSAYHSQTRIQINGYDEPNWRGSGSNNVCEIEGVNFANY